MFDPREIKEQLLALKGVKSVQIETVRQVIVETSTGRDHETINAIHNAEIKIIKQNPAEVFDFLVFYGEPGEPEQIEHWNSWNSWDSNER